MAKYTGTSAADTITITTGVVDDEIDGGAGNDKIRSGSGNDVVHGDDGNDAINGEAGDDILYGDAGDDTLTGDAGNDILYGGDGNDGFFGGGSNDQIYGGNGNDNMFGDGGDDVLDGGMGADKLTGGIGNDTFIVTVGEGGDTITGGAGTDTLELRFASSDVTAAFRSDLAAYQSYMNDQLASAGSMSALSAQTTGTSFTFSSLGLTISGTEAINLKLDGNTVALQSLLNVAPVAVTDVVVVPEDTPVSGNVLSNDTDADNNTLTVTGYTVDGVAGTIAAGTATVIANVGTLVINADGSFSFSPSANYNGSVPAVSYSITDGNGQTASAALVLGPVDAQNDAPVVASAVVVATIDEDTVLNGQVVASDIDGDVLEYSVSQAPVHGAVTVNALTGAYSYQPSANYNGEDAFIVQVRDPFGLIVAQRVEITVVAQNDAPVTAAVVTQSVNEDAVLTGQVVASDIDGDVLGYSVSQGPAHGAVTVNATTGAYTYQPTVNFNGADSFVVQVRDPSGATVTQRVDISVVAQNDAPVVASAVVAATINEDTVLNGQVVASDIDGDVLAYSVSQGAAHGSVSVNAVTGAYSYQPAANYSGADAFIVQVRDPSGSIVTQRVEVTVKPVVDQPFLTVTNANPSAGFTTTGTSGNDVLTGGAGADVINGGAGNDTIYGDGSGKVRVALTVNAALVDTDGSETLRVVISGVPAAALLSAGQNNGNGSWTLTVQDLSGLTILASDAADFTLSVAVTATEWDGSTSTRTAALSVAFERGGNGDTLSDGDGTDTVYGGLGNDRLIAGLGNDTYDGGDGFDILDMSAATVAVTVDLSKSLATGLGTDKVLNIEGVVGSSFNDTLTGSKYDSWLWGANGNDKIYGAAGNDMLDGGNGNDTLDGGAGNDVLNDGAGDDTSNGGSGDDTFIAGDGKDTYIGGSGFDVVDYSAATRAVNVDASKKSITGYTDDKVDGIEKFIGSAFADVFKGGSTANYFDGGAGNDSFRGMGGKDVYTGGKGDDSFMWYVKDIVTGSKLLGADFITDFGNGRDVLNLSEFTKAYKGANVNDVVHITDTGAGSMVSVKTVLGFVDLVLLQDVHQVTVNSLLADGMIIA